MSLQIFGTRKCPATRKAERFFRDRGLAYLDYDPVEEILANPALLRTPIVRDGRRSAVGDDPAAWRDLAAGGDDRG